MIEDSERGLRRGASAKPGDRRGPATIAGLLAATLLSACTTTQPPATGAWVSLSGRLFDGIPRETVIRAAEVVLRQPGHDPRAWTFVPKAEGFTASRSYAVYAVLAAETGVDNWQFFARSEGSGTRADVLLSRSSSKMAGTIGPMIGVGVMMASPNSAGASAGEPIHSPFTYQLFWDRIDYVLGRRDHWPSCSEIRGRAPQNDPAGPSLFGMCLLVGGEQPPPQRLVGR